MHGYLACKKSCFLFKFRVELYHQPFWGSLIFIQFYFIVTESSHPIEYSLQRNAVNALAVAAWYFFQSVRVEPEGMSVPVNHEIVN
jgi:hypothetical protein